MAHFRHQFTVSAPLDAVWKLHAHPDVLADLTPPPVKVQLLQIDEPLRAGARLRFRLSVGPLGSVWDVTYDEFEPYQPGVTRCGFVDRALSSPFHFWTHRHTFEVVGETTSTITDEARFELIGGAAGEIVNWLFVWPAIWFLFLYRRIKTRLLLAGQK